MKYLMILLCLGVCYVSLPVSSRVVANGETAEEHASPAVAVAIPAAVAVAAADSEPTAEAEPAAAEEAKTESADADKNGEEKKSEEKPADKDEAAKDKNAASKDKDEAKEDKDEAKKEDAEKTDTKKTKKEAKKKRKTAKVKAKRVKVDVTLDGTFTAEKMTPVALRPEEWSQFEILEVVEHGSEVHEGQVLVKFDSEKIDEEIADLELSQHVSELAIRKAEQELPRLEKTLTMAATEAERNDKNAREDFDRYHEIERPMIVKSIEYTLKYAQFSLDYEQDELDQLEKMYEADDLTEETEEIVLKRQKNAVDFAQFNVEQTRQYCDEILDVRLPRADVAIKESLDKAALELARAKTALALDLNRARYELEQQKETRAKSLDRHAKLLVDRALMELKAPADGIVYYGECEDGNWSDMASMISKLKPHNSVSADTVVMTILEKRPLSVSARVGEDKRADFAAGKPAKIVPPLENSEWIKAKVKSVSEVPVTTGKFGVEVDPAGSELPEWIVAGMSCKVKVTTYDKQDALVVPKKAVQTDKENEEQKFVWLVDSEDADAKPERRNVKLGKTSGDDVEVLKGLKKGDVISLEDEEKKEVEDKKEDE